MVDRQVGAASAVMWMLHQSVVVKKVEQGGKALNLPNSLCLDPQL